ncbi:MAG: CDP-alcohol phosphatidyltransferase family protein, partial [Caulobacteraceae bacterium]
AGATPDAISAASVVFALLGAAAFVLAERQEPAARAALLIGAGVCVQLRLVCNLMDGLVAVEHGRGGPYGPIWNELPDRFADVAFLLGAGYGAAVHLPWASALGWSAAVLAVLTAYVRELGRGLGFPADFSGPMAKPQRMAVLTFACALAAAEPLWGWHGQVMTAALGLITLGAAVTVLRRTLGLARQLKGRQA